MKGEVKKAVKYLTKVKVEIFVNVGKITHFNPHLYSFH